jgi:tRNA(Ile)-lysidine synthase
MPRRIAVAASGGRDSTALLHATARAARGQGIEVVALHVHHGLMPQADAWQAQLKSQCDRWARSGLPVTLRAHCLDGTPPRGASVEAWARRERYKALASMAMAEGAAVVLLAHHRHDQAETFLLQALRGAGPAGLAGMPRQAEREGITWVRPWLHLPGSAIEHYVQRFRLAYAIDTSNADARFARSRLRTEVWPVLGKAFPQADVAFESAAALAYEAASCMEDLAAMDLAACDATPEQLPVQRWSGLSPARRANALRRWLQPHIPEGVPHSLVQRMVSEVPSARSGACWPAAPGVVRLHRGALLVEPPPFGAAPAGTVAIDLCRPGRYAVPQWGGEFIVTAAPRGGIAVALLARAQLRARQGAERFQFAPNATPRGLKKQFQARGLAIGARAVPLVWSGTQLIFVPGLGIDARAVAAAGEPANRIEWRASPAR